MNVLDVVMAVGLAVGVLVGFVRGMVQQAMGLVAIYLSVVVGVWAHRLFGLGLKALLPALTPASANILGFMTVVVILLIILDFVIRDIEKNARWMAKIPPVLNQTGGLLLGFATAVFWLGLVSTALNVVGHAPWKGAEEFGRTLVRLVNGSFMTAAMHYAFRLGLYTITPWIPGELPEIFTTPL